MGNKLWYNHIGQKLHTTYLAEMVSRSCSHFYGVSGGRLVKFLLVLVIIFHGRANAITSVNCFKVLGLHASDTVLVNTIVAEGFIYYTPLAGRPRDTFKPIADTVAALLARYPDIEFRSSSMHTTDAFKLGYIIRLVKGTVDYMVCYDTNVVRRHIHYLDLAASYDEEVTNRRSGFAVIPRAQGQSAEIWHKRSDGFIIKARYDTRGLPVAVFIYGPQGASYSSDLRELENKLSAKSLPAAVAAKPATSANTTLPVVVLGTSTELVLLKKELKDILIQQDNMIRTAGEQVKRGKSSSDFHYIEDKVLELGLPLLNMDKRVDGIYDRKIAAELKEVKRLITLYRTDITKLAVSAGLAAKAKEHTEWYVKNVEDTEKILKDMTNCLVKIDDQLILAGKKLLK